MPVLEIFEPILKLLAKTQPWWDRPAPRRWLARLAQPFLSRIAETAKLPAEMALPKLAVRHLRDRYPALVERASSPDQGGVAYFHGCAANYFDDGVGDAVIGVLRKHGVEPALPPQRCSGTPIETYGHVDIVKKHARFNLESFAPYDTIVTGCASCHLMLKDYTKLFQNEPEQATAERLSKKVVHITEFVARAKDKPPTASAGGDDASCHLPFILPSAGSRGDQRAAKDPVRIAGRGLCRDAGCRPLRRRRRNVSRQRL